MDAHICVWSFCTHEGVYTQHDPALNVDTCFTNVHITITLAIDFVVFHFRHAEVCSAACAFTMVTLHPMDNSRNFMFSNTHNMEECTRRILLKNPFPVVFMEDKVSCNFLHHSKNRIAVDLLFK